MSSFQLARFITLDFLEKDQVVKRIVNTNKIRYISKTEEAGECMIVWGQNKKSIIVNSFKTIKNVLTPADVPAEVPSK